MPLFDKKIIHCQIRDAALYWILIPGAVIFSGLFLDQLLDLKPWPASSIAFPAVLLCNGLLIVILSTRDLKRLGHGTPNPGRPPKKLVCQGIYRFCRHPMFLGYDLSALGVILFFSSVGMLCISFPVFIVLQIRFLKKEEILLAKKFKTSYAEYQRTTSFLLPFLQTS